MPQAHPNVLLTSVSWYGAGVLMIIIIVLSLHIILLLDKCKQICTHDNNSESPIMNSFLVVIANDITKTHTPTAVSSIKT